MCKGFVFTAYTYSPLHVGVGQSMGIVDQPIEREKHTNYPVVYASGVKGALRAHFANPIRDILKRKTEKIEEEKQKTKVIIDKIGFDFEAIFGPEEGTAGAGGAIFTDLKILLFPVRASEGTFKYVTCERVLKRFKKDVEIADKKFTLDIDKLKKVEPTDNEKDSIILEDFNFEKKYVDVEKDIKIKLPEVGEESVILIEDDYFDYLVSNATQIIARNVLDEHKKSENLWYEEYLPTDTVLYSFIKPSIADNSGKNLDKFKSKFDEGFIIQIGGNETIGKGIVELKKINFNGVNNENVK